MVITGTGGQGLITLLQIISEAAMADGFDVRTSELHGLSQRGGSVEVHIRFGKKIFSPLVSLGRADLILALESQEALRATYFAGPQTTFLINQFIIPLPLAKSLNEAQINKELKKISHKIFMVPAGETCKKELATDVVAGVYLLGWAVSKKMIPLKPSSFKSAVKKTIPAKYLELNIKALNLAEEKI